MKRFLTIAFALILSAAAFVSAAPVPCTFYAWEANPLATRFSGDAIAVRGRGTLAPVVAAPHAANVTVSVDEDGVHGITEQLSALRESDPYLFEDKHQSASQAQPHTIRTGIAHRHEPLDSDSLSDADYYRQIKKM